MPENHQQSSVEIQTTEGSQDLSQVHPEQLVSYQPEGARRPILVEAGTVLASDRTPIREAEDGGIRRLDGQELIKLGNEVITVSSRGDR